MDSSGLSPTPRKSERSKSAVNYNRLASGAKDPLSDLDEHLAPKSKKLEAKRVASGVQPKVEDDSRIASLEAKIEALTACLAVAMESTIPSSANEVSLDELPFEL